MSEKFYRVIEVRTREYIVHQNEYALKPHEYVQWSYPKQRIKVTEKVTYFSSPLTITTSELQEVSPERES